MRRGRHKLPRRVIARCRVDEKTLVDPEQVEQLLQGRHGQILRLLDVLELPQLLQRKARELIHGRGIKLSPRQAQHDLACVRERGNDDYEEIGLQPEAGRASVLDSKLT